MISDLAMINQVWCYHNVQSDLAMILVMVDTEMD